MVKEKEKSLEVSTWRNEVHKVTEILTTVKFITFKIHIVIAKLTIMVTNSRRTKKYKHLFRHP